jgi:RNA polymerase sigma-70 factor (ECF subfamily)
MTQPAEEDGERRVSFDRLLGEIRPKLHRYCSRMAGSAVDGEDIVQDVLMKAVRAFEGARIDNIESWIFRIAHNTAIDFHRRRRRQDEFSSDEDPDMTIDETTSADGRHVAAASLRTFMQLPVAQRGCVILMDVFGYSLQEVGRTTGLSIPAVKAALHRGRTRLREIASEPDVGAVPALSQDDLRRLSTYVERFNSRDFDAVREMLAGDVRLELVARTRMQGRDQVSRYFHNYSGIYDWRFVPGLVDRRPALLVIDPADLTARPTYFVLIKWSGDDVVGIRDFRHARYAAESAEMVMFGSVAGSS